MKCDQVDRGNKIRVLIADNSHIHTQLLAAALKRDDMLEVVSSDCESDGLIAAAVAHRINVLVTSPNLDEHPGRGLEVLRELRTIRPEVRTVVLLDSSKPEIILDAFRSGARGVFSKYESVEALCKCIRCVFQGQTWANSEELAVALKALASSPTIRAISPNGLSMLSKRELEVVRCLAEGLTNREIADHLGLSQHTVKNYLFRIFDKLGVSNRIELLFMSLSQGGTSQSLAVNPLLQFTDAGVADGTLLAEFREAAEKGEPVAQLALAQMYSARKTSPDNLVQAYTWYLIAREQISRALENTSMLMPPEQIAEAKRRVTGWLTKARKPASSSGIRGVDIQPGVGSVASAD